MRTRAGRAAEAGIDAATSGIIKGIAKLDEKVGSPRPDLVKMAAQLQRALEERRVTAANWEAKRPGGSMARSFAKQVVDLETKVAKAQEKLAAWDAAHPDDPTRED
ncbi:MAG: hypothetical protein FWF90_12965 [Promicromonosporaceae bacterium]|nr:hypothetical protein [Promicromonosporaceae bacterium]